MSGAAACTIRAELCQATSASHLRKLLGEEHRYVFTLIHKFRTKPRTLHPVQTERDDINALTEDEKLRKVPGQRDHLITRDDRLDAVAKDIVNCGDQGKSMVVSIDKLTTLRMYEKVRAEWETEKTRVLKSLEGMASRCRSHWIDRLTAEVPNPEFMCGCTIRPTAARLLPKFPAAY